MATQTTSSFITGSVGTTIRGENKLVKFEPGYDQWGRVMNRNLELISQGLQFAGNTKDMQVTGTLDFGSSNVWMTRSNTIHLSESFDLNMVGKFWLPGGYGNTRTVGTTQIPVFWQSAATSKPTKIIQCDLTTTNDWDLDATNWWRFRIKSSSSLGLSNKVTYETNTKNLRAFIPTPMMQEVTQFELQNGVNEVLIFEAARRGSNAPVPVWNPTLKITYVVANDASTFDV